MSRVFRLSIYLLLLCFALAACRDEKPRQSSGPPTDKIAAPRAEKYPIPFVERPYRDIHEKAKEAWFLTETAYLVVADKYAASRSGEQRENITAEIDRNLFGVNETVEALFKEAIEAQPDNPLNHATYAYYLKPRKRFLPEGGFLPTDGEALEQIEMAIEMWPDESGFYLQKVLILTAPHQAYDYFRAGAMEEVAIADRMDEIRDALSKAERYYPQNHFINYWSALLQFRYTPEEELERLTPTLLREIAAGNRKREGYFIFPAPVFPYNAEAQYLLLDPSLTEAVYYDHWFHNGSYSQVNVNRMVEHLLAGLQWPRDKEQIADLMFFYYSLGRTKPFDRSFFSMQHVIIEQVRTSLAKDHPDTPKLAEAHRFLNDQYRSIANRLYGLKVITDPSRIGVRGINEVESGAPRQVNIKESMQGPQAAYLNRFGELLGVDFPLPEDKSDW